MDTPSLYLSNEHRRCDEHLADAETAAAGGDWSTARAHLAAFIADTEAHFAREEAVLFPAFEAASGMRGSGPTEVMRMEHAQIRSGFAALEAALGDARAFLGQIDTLLILLQQHNIKEEQVLYPMAERLLAGEPALLARLREAA